MTNICLIEDGNGSWGVSLMGPNPLAKNFISCKSKDNAVKLFDILDTYQYDIIEGILLFVIDDAPRECPHWGHTEYGFGPCNKCIACKILTELD